MVLRGGGDLRGHGNQLGGCFFLKRRYKSCVVFIQPLLQGVLTEVGILLDGSTFQAENVSSFQHDGVTNLLFPFEDVKLNIGKFAMWRIQTHGRFG